MNQHYLCQVPFQVSGKGFIAVIIVLTGNNILYGVVPNCIDKEDISAGFYPDMDICKNVCSGGNGRNIRFLCILREFEHSC